MIAVAGARLLLLILPLLFASCATIVSGSSDAVSFDSNPDGARVYVDGVVVGRTPCQARVSRAWGRGHIAMTLGGETRETDVPRTVNGWYFGNIFFGGLIGLLLVDLPTGNCRRTPDGTTVFMDFMAVPAPAEVAKTEPEKPPPGTQ